PSTAQHVLIAGIAQIIHACDAAPLAGGRRTDPAALANDRRRPRLAGINGLVAKGVRRWILAGDAAGIFSTGRGYYCGKSTPSADKGKSLSTAPSHPIALSLLARDPVCSLRRPLGGRASGKAV